MVTPPYLGRGLPHNNDSPHFWVQLTMILIGAHCVERASVCLVLVEPAAFERAVIARYGVIITIVIGPLHRSAARYRDCGRRKSHVVDRDIVGIANRARYPHRLRYAIGASITVSHRKANVIGPRLVVGVRESVGLVKAGRLRIGIWVVGIVIIGIPIDAKGVIIARAPAHLHRPRAFFPGIKR